MDRLTISIAGAGIGGLAAASALAMRGHDVKVIEQAPAITEIGAGIQISPNGYAVIEALGLGDALAEVSVRAKTVRLIDGPSGRDVVTMVLHKKKDRKQ